MANGDTEADHGPDWSVMAMAHSPEIGDGFPEPTFGAGFWTVCHRHKTADSE